MIGGYHTMSRIKYLLGPMRVPFLALTPTSVFLGFAGAVWTSGTVDFWYLFLVLIGALSAHISVNALNEYYDFKSGLDLRAKRTPFSGGSGTLPQRPQEARNALATGLTAFCVTSMVGVFFLCVRGLLLLPLGVIGLVLVFTYTIWLTRRPLLCLIAPGLGFGQLMVMGTGFALTGGYSWATFIASLIPFFLVSNLLLLNQFPDVDADQTVGRRHFPITVGKRNSALIYGTFLFSAYASIAAGVWCACLPRLSLIGLISVIIAAPTFLGVVRYAEDTERLITYMGMNVIIVLGTPVLVGIGFLLG